jgi:serine/threonine-protein kinase HipA
VLQILGEVVEAVSQWRDMARRPEIGMTEREIAVFEPAFEHATQRQARRQLAL